METSFLWTQFEKFESIKDNKGLYSDINEYINEEFLHNPALDNYEETEIYLEDNPIFP